MKKILYILIFLSVALTVKAQFTAGNLVVLRVGDSVAAFTANGNSLAIDQWTPNGVFVNTTLLPKTGSNAVCLNGTSTSEGQLTLSTNRTNINFMGYRIAPPHSASVNGATAATVNRAVVSINAAGTISIPTFTSTNFSLGNVRGVISNGTAFWASGSNTGIVHSPGSSFLDTIVSASSTNTRHINIFAGQLFYTTASGTSGVWRVGTGIPTASGTVSTPYIATGTSSPYGFAFNNDTNICYIADDGATSAGIQKWVRTGSTWTLAYTLGTGTTGVGARGLVVNWGTSPKPTIYATTAEASNAPNRVIRIMDSSATATAVTLATAPALTIYRGITLAPGSNALPVSWRSFNATKNTNGNLLKWSTASESNNSHFEIQRSADGRTYESIARVKGNGTTTRVSNYSFTDITRLTNKVTYYRLKQVDMDGKFEYSKTVSLVNTENRTGITATLPNPFAEELSVNVQIAASANATIQVVDMLGKTHLSTTELLEAGNNKISIPTSDMSDGIYFVRITANGETFTQKVIKK